MKQKVVIDVVMKSKKYQSKALQIAFLKDGVISAGFIDKNKSRIEVIGEGFIDAVGLAEALRKKVGFADLVSVEEVEEKKN